MSGIVGKSPMKSGLAGKWSIGAAIQTKSMENYTYVGNDGTNDTPSNTKLDITITPGNHVLIMSTLSFRLYGSSTSAVSCSFNIRHNSPTDGSYAEITETGNALSRESYDESGDLPSQCMFEGVTNLTWMHKNVSDAVNWYKIYFQMGTGTFIKIAADSNWGTTMTLMEIQA